MGVSMLLAVVKRHTNILKQRGGFSLIELVIGLSLISIMMPSTMMVFQQVLQAKFFAESRITASNLATEVLEHTMRLRFSQIISVPLTSFGWDNNNGNCWDDRNYNWNEHEAGEDSPYCDPMYINFVYQVPRADADPGVLDAAACGAGCDPDYKKVTVEVWNTMTNASVRLVSLAVNNS